MPFLQWPEVFEAALAFPPPDPLVTPEYGGSPRRSIVVRRDIRDYHHPEPRRFDEADAPRDEPMGEPIHSTIVGDDGEIEEQP